LSLKAAYKNPSSKRGLTMATEGNLKIPCPLSVAVTREIVKRNQPGFQILPRRWVVERTFAWLVNNRRLSKDYEQLSSVSEAMVYAAMSRLMLQRLAQQSSSP
jgi:hypothetical protein